MIDLDKSVESWVKLKTRPISLNCNSPALTLIDLFCGCGGLTLGAWEAARQAGMCLNIQYAIDWSTAALAVYKANFSASAQLIENRNIESLFGNIGEPITDEESRFQDQVKSVDLVVAGPPCQGHSDLNNSSRRNDPRNKLYLKVIRVAEIVRPSVLLIENVPTVIHDTENVVSEAERTLTSLGYNVDHAIVSMVKVGVPQRRRRHLLVACQKEKFFISDFIDSIPHTVKTVGDFFADLVDEPMRRSGPFYQPSRTKPENTARIAHLFNKNLFNLPNELRPACHRDKEHAYVSMYGRMYWDKPAQTLTSGFGSMGQGRYVHPTMPRMITPHEGARLQGFPDYFDFSCIDRVTELREMIANAVPPPLSLEFVAEFIRRALM